LALVGEVDSMLGRSRFFLSDSSYFLEVGFLVVATGQGLEQWFLPLVARNADGYGILHFSFPRMVTREIDGLDIHHAFSSSSSSWPSGEVSSSCLEARLLLPLESARPASSLLWRSLLERKKKKNLRLQLFQSFTLEVAFDSTGYPYPDTLADLLPLIPPLLSQNRFYTDHESRGYQQQRRYITCCQLSEVTMA
jgi:hypothetical protein